MSLHERVLTYVRARPHARQWDVARALGGDRHAVSAAIWDLLWAERLRLTRDWALVVADGA